MISGKVTLTIEKGGPGSGHRGHAGRPGEVGGSVSDGNNSEFSTKISVHSNIKSLLNSRDTRGKIIGFFITPDDKILAQNSEETYGGHNEIAKILYESEEYRDMFKDNVFDESDKEQYEKGAIRSGFIRAEIMDNTSYKGIISDEHAVITSFFQSYEINKSTLHKIQDFLSPDLGISTVVWETEDVFTRKHIEVDYIDFISASSVGVRDNSIILKESKAKLTINKGGPGSGFRGHAGRPGEVGGSRTGKLASRDKLYDKKLWMYFDRVGIESEYYAEKKASLTDAVKSATNGKFDGHPLEFIESAWVMRSENYSTVLKDIEIDGHGGWQITGVIYNNISGEEVGRFSRVFSGLRRGEIWNREFKMNESDQGSGFGTEFYRHSEEFLKSSGVSVISLFANSDVGGYAWARLGYNFMEDSKVKNNLISLVKDQWELDTPNVVFPKVENAWDIAALDNGIDYSDSLANGSDSYTRLGKAFMLGTSWDAVKYLDDSEQSWQVGEIYYNSKVKK